MAWLFQPLLMLLARSTESELARHDEFLKAEHQILRGRLRGQVRLKPGEQRLLVARTGHRRHGAAGVADGRASKS